MKTHKLFIFLLLVSVHLIGYSQTLKKIAIGYNYQLNSEVVANEIVFPGNITSWSTDDSCRNMYMEIAPMIDSSSTGTPLKQLMHYDMGAKKLVWMNPVANDQIQYSVFDKNVIKVEKNISSGVDSITGKSNWSTKNRILYVDKTLNIGIGYHQSSENEDSGDRLEGIDLKTGTVLWKRSVSRDYGINEIYSFKEHVVLFIADGIHYLDLTSGFGWDLNARTGKKDYSTTIAANAFSILLAAVTNTEPAIFTGHDLFTDMNSNILVDSTNMFFADRNTVFKVNDEGIVLWSNPALTGKAGKSSLLLKDSLLGMINWGYSFKNGEIVYNSKPYFAFYRKDNGQKVFSNTINYAHEKLISYQILGEDLFLMSTKRLFKYSLQDGREKWEQTFSTDSVGELSSFCDDLYLDKDSVFVPVGMKDSITPTIKTAQNKVLVLSDEMGIIHKYSYPELYSKYLDYGNFKFLVNNNHTVIIDKNGRFVADLDIASNVVVKNNILYEVESNSLVEIDLNQFKK